MWKQIHKKLRSRSGETLAEVLVALLIIGLASMLLVVMINTAGSINIKIRNRDKAFYEDLTRAETHTIADGETAGSGKIIIKDTEENELEEINVTVYGGNKLISYEKPSFTEDGGDAP